MDFFIYYNSPNMQVVTDLSETPGEVYDPVEQLTAGQSAFLAANPTAAAQEVRDMALTPAPPPTFEQNKAAKLVELQAWYNSEISAGYYDATLDLTMDLSLDAQGIFDRQLALETIRPSLDSDPVVVIDYVTSVIHTPTFGQYKELLVRYGDAFKALRIEYVQTETAINDAENQTELDAVDMP